MKIASISNFRRYVVGSNALSSPGDGGSTAEMGQSKHSLLGQHIGSNKASKVSNSTLLSFLSYNADALKLMFCWTSSCRMGGSKHHATVSTISSHTQEQRRKPKCLPAHGLLFLRLVNPNCRKIDVCQLISRHSTCSCHCLRSRLYAHCLAMLGG